MKNLQWTELTTRRFLGLAVMALGVIVLVLPILVGEWVIALLGIFLIGAGLAHFIQTIRSADQTITWFEYIAGVGSVILGLILFLSPTLVLSGVIIVLTLFFVGDGAIKIFQAFRQSGAERRWALFNGVFTILLGILIWYLLSARIGIAAIGIVLGLRLILEGWTMFFLPEAGKLPDDFKPDARVHPDQRLGLQPSDIINDMQSPLLGTYLLDRRANIVWCLTLLLVFFAIHVFRTDAQWSFIGFISPFSAVIGDAVVALIMGLVLMLPLRLLWRKLSRPFERATWHRFTSLNHINSQLSSGERALRGWLAMRMKFAIELRRMRYSLNYAFWRLLRVGLPLTAIFIAVNSIWGFSWYFNSENWASAVWQEITKERVDVWRRVAAANVEADALRKGIPTEKIFAIEPEGVTNDGDFSFIVIGDTGEGDPSQMVLRDQLIASGKRDSTRFLIVSSDVIYPDGKMKDYETNFYLPFKGFDKPIYAIPGNHDWFDADEGFNANFLERDSAILSLRARLKQDSKTDVINLDKRFDEITQEADRLRKYYGIRNGLQRAPFFEMHTDRFSVIAVDTGILRRVDEKEKQWLEAALARAGNNFKLVVLGHPLYAAGAYQGENDAPFKEIHDILKRFKVDVAMAGDTHDFEFYKEKYVSDAEAREMLHFVNGGGGAYLSIGTALAFPKQPPTADYAFYPRTDEVTQKIKREAPFWKMPVLAWMKWLGGYPLTQETLSGVFDFNRAPFFQSFMEIIVERSQNRVRLLLYGVNGQLRWRDLQVGGEVKPAEKSDDDFVEWVLPLAQTH